jgi:hypothetical protein
MGASQSGLGQQCCDPDPSWCLSPKSDFKVSRNFRPAFFINTDYRVKAEANVASILLDIRHKPSKVSELVI